MLFFKKIKNFLLGILNSSSRTGKSVKNIIISMFSKCVSILVSFLIVPLTISYLNPTQYGIWLTISSIIAWIAYFDLGLGNGFRNCFAKAKAQGDIHLAKQYVSTTYFAISAIVTCVVIFVLIANCFVDWTAILNLDHKYMYELRFVFGIVSSFFCLNMIVNVFSFLLLADQKPGLLSSIQVIGQLLSLGVIYLLTKFSSGSLSELALYYSGIPCLTMIIASFLFFNFTKYKIYRPHIKFIKTHLIKKILNVGIQFFFIYLCLILVFQVINIIITRELGPERVTEYNVAYKYFNILYMVMVIIITPFWSAFTDAYAQGDYVWMKSTLKRLEIVWTVFVFIGVIMLFVSSLFYRIWIGDSVHVPLLLSVAMFFYIEAQLIGAIYMQLINGIGTIRIQFIIYVVFAIVSWPLVTFSCRSFGVYGATLFPTLVYLIQAFFGKIQLTKLLSQKATGVWNR